MNFMLKLKNIKIENDIVKCDMLPEDSSEWGHIVVNLKDKTIQEYDLPHGYEWCKNHVEHAKDKLIVMYENNSFQSETTIMWY